MKIVKEVTTVGDFEFWSGAKSTVDYLTYNECNQILELLDDACPEGMTETELNDFFWFETDTIAEWLGFADFDEIINRGDEDEEI